MAYIKPTMSCAAAFPWSAALRNPEEGLHVVLRDALALAYIMPRLVCARALTLIGQRTQELHRRREVAVLICGVEVLKRPCHCFAEQGERENAASQESCDPP